MRTPNRPLAPQRALWELQQAMPADTIYTCDIGEHLLFAIHTLRIDAPDGFVTMTGLSSMGSGIGASLGAKLGKPDRPVAAICGDGGFAMSGSSLIATAVRAQIPILVCVLNDGRFGMVENGMEATYGRHPRFSTGKLDVVAMAQGVGARAMVVDRYDQLLKLPLAAMLVDGPLVIDVRIDPTARMAKNGRFEQLKRQQQSKKLN